MKHARGKPYHPMTQGKIERYHGTMKNLVKLQNYWYPEDLEQEIGNFVDYYNHHRVHESLKNVTPVEMYQGKQREILSRSEMIKRKTIGKRKLQNLSSGKRSNYNVKSRITL